MDYGQAIKAGADSGISAMVGELDDVFGSKKQLSATNRKKASQATGLIDDAADAPRPRTNALPDVEVTPSRGAVKNATSGLADAGAGTGNVGRKSNTTALSKKNANAKKSSPSLSKNQQKMQSQTVGSALSGNTTEKIKTSNVNTATINVEISASGKPEDILFAGATLNKRQQRLLSQLQNYGDITVTKKNNVNFKDISALTAYTNNEFALFTNSGQRMIIRGNSVKVPVNIDIAQEYAAKGWRWSGHSHPGISKIVLEPSDSDRIILQQFKNQKHSATVNSTGSYRKFGKDWSDWLPTY